jgi:hypothetical protein
MTGDDERRAEFAATSDPSRSDRRISVPPALVRDIDRMLLDHSLDLPTADSKAALAWLLSGSYGGAIGGGTGPYRHLAALRVAEY